jgi:hypothetical protein
MANLRYPENLDGSTSPWILFSTQKPQYDRRSASAKTSASGDSVGLYFPTGYTVSDSLDYDTGDLGIIGGTIDKFTGGAGGTTIDDVRRLVGETVGTGVGTGARALSALTGTGDIYKRASQRVANPQEFMLFKSPSMREFSFSFTFLPQSETEADTIPQIIRFFRRAAYPVELNSLEYRFPDTFAVSFQQSPDDVIRMPEVACTGVNITYNPNSMSYFTNGNQPVETTLELSFTELRPISRGLVEQGF